jgi:23S rRNA pseudouridine2605 synthase/23S rRNA pseudouridine2604 synthase
MEEIRLQKYLSQAWICSRRKAEEYIAEWLVSVNWEIAQIWQKVIDWKDKVELLDKAIKMQKEFVYYKYNKPRGVVTTMASRWELAIVDILDIKERIFPIWRLDKDTTGLILLTTDGRLANFLMHPKYEHQKEYMVKTYGPITDESLDIMRKWVYMLWRMTKECKIERLSTGLFSITLTEWRNRQIRRMVESIWGEVKWLKRIRVENIFLDTLEEGKYKHLSKWEKNELFANLWIKADA